MPASPVKEEVNIGFKKPEDIAVQPQINRTSVTLPSSSIVGLGALGLTNMGTTQVGGQEIAAIAAFLNLVAQWIKMPDWLDQNLWLIPVILILAFGAAFFVWHDAIKAFLNGSLAALQSIMNYRAWKATGLGGLPSATYHGQQ